MGDKAGLFKNGNEFNRQNGPESGMNPAYKCFSTDQTTGCTVVLWLIIYPELLVQIGRRCSCFDFVDAVSLFPQLFGIERIGNAVTVLDMHQCQTGIIAGNSNGCTAINMIADAVLDVDIRE